MMKNPEAKWLRDFWQRVKDSNPHIQSQSLLCYLYTNPLYLSAAANRYYYTEKWIFVNRVFQSFFFFQRSFFPPNRPFKKPPFSLSLPALFSLPAPFSKRSTASAAPS